MPNYGVLKVLGNSERKIAESLKVRAGIETFLPRITRTIIIRHKPQTRTVPMFPGYLIYTHHDDINEHSWRLINGITGSLKNGGRVSLLPEGFVEALRERCGPDLLFAAPSPVAARLPKLEAGTRVRFNGGPFL